MRKKNTFAPLDKDKGMLALLWQRFLKNSNYIYSLDLLIEEYNVETRRLGGAKKSNRKTKASLTDDVYSGSMSVRTFTHIMYNLIDTDSMSLGISLTHSNSYITRHSVVSNKNDNNHLNLLKNLWDNVLIDNDLVKYKKSLISKYLNTNRKKSVAQKRKTRTSLKEALDNDNMSVITFVHLIFVFLNVKHMTVSLKVNLTNGKEIITNIRLKENNNK